MFMFKLVSNGTTKLSSYLVDCLVGSCIISSSNMMEVIPPPYILDVYIHIRYTSSLDTRQCKDIIQVLFYNKFVSLNEDIVP